MVSLVKKDGKEFVHYSQAEKNEALEYFVTSATDQIYAVKHNVPSEVFGSFGSFFSRNPKDLREHLFDAIIGNIKDFEIQAWRGKENLERLLFGYYKDPAQAIESGLAKSQSFFTRYYGGYSHKSIANTVWIPMVATNVSQLFARNLAYDQLAFFIEQSSRFVKMDVNNYFVDKDVDDSEFRNVYRNSIEFSLSSYAKLKDKLVQEFSERLPFGDWLDLQNEATRKNGEAAQKIKYERELTGRALDSSRFLLPQATFTNIAWILDARSAEFDIGSWKGHGLREMREAAELYEKHAGQIAPSLLKYTNRNEFYADKYNLYNGDLNFDVEAKPVEKSFNILEFPDDALNKTIAHILHNSSRGNFRPYYEKTKRMTFEQKRGILERIICNRKKFDEWVGVEEEFNMLNVVGEIITDIGATRDWRRHQKFNRKEPVYSLDMGYKVPPSIQEIGGESLDLFHEVIRQAHEAELKIRKKFPLQAQYVIPMACNHSITFSQGLDQWLYTIFTRSTPEGNWSYREDSFNIAEAFLKKAPWIVGYREYPEGMKVVEAYEKAPFTRKMREQQKDWRQRKSIAEEKQQKFNELEPFPSLLILRTEETGLHT